MEDMLRVGVISSTHGVRGEVKVFPTTDDPARFEELETVLLDTGKEKLELEIAGVKFFKNMVILKFKGYDSINDVERYRGGISGSPGSRRFPWGRTRTLWRISSAWRW